MKKYIQVQKKTITDDMFSTEHVREVNTALQS